MRWVMLSTSSRDNGLTEDDIDRPRLSQMFFETFNGHQRLLWPASDDGLFHRPVPAVQQLQLGGCCWALGTQERATAAGKGGERYTTKSCQRGNAKAPSSRNSMKDKQEWR